MSDSGSTGHLQFTGTAAARGAASVPEARRPQPVAMLVLDTVTGQVTAANPAGRRRISEAAGSALTRWLAALATIAGHADQVDDVTTVHAWRGTDGANTAPVTVWIQATVIDHRARRSLLVVLREDGAPSGADTERTTADPTCAVFTLDTMGRVDSWGTGAQRWTVSPPSR